MPPELATAAAAVVVGVITGLVTWLVARANLASTARTTQQNVSAQIETARIQAVDDAYEKAEAQLGRTIDRLNGEVTELEGDVQRLKTENRELRGRVESMNASLAQCRTVCRRLANKLGEPTPDFDA